MPETERQFAEQPAAREMPRPLEQQPFEQIDAKRTESAKPADKEAPSTISTVPYTPAPRFAPVRKSETRIRVEQVMEEGLEQVYQTMPPETKKQFKEAGEKTAAEIETMLYKVKIQSKKVFQLMFSWLRLIPGVNRYFLEQEAKLKTDEIIKLKEEIEKTKADQRVW